MAEPPPAAFDVRAWLAANPAPPPTRVSRPVEVGCWTKESSLVGGAYRYGCRDGAALGGGWRR
jgi:hypothetical protein